MHRCPASSSEAAHLHLVPSVTHLVPEHVNFHVPAVLHHLLCWERGSHLELLCYLDREMLKFKKVTEVWSEGLPPSKKELKILWQVVDKTHKANIVIL